MRRKTLLVSITLMLAVMAAACGSAETKPAAEPPAPTPTAIPTATATAVDQDTDAGANADAAGAGLANLADPAVRDCLEEQLGQSFDPETVGPGGDLFGRLGPRELAMLEECGVDVSDGFGSALGGFGGGGGRGAFTPEVQACLTEQLGEDFGGGFGGRDGGGGGLGGGLGEDFTAALEECGVDFGEGGFGGFGGFGDRGGGGRRFGGGDGSLQDCLTELLGADALGLLRNPDSGPSPELLEAFEQCGGPIPVEPGGGSGDGAGPIAGDPSEEPTATPIPASDLAVDELACLAAELEAAELASVVIATSSGDHSELSDEALAAMATCGIGS